MPKSGTKRPNSRNSYVGPYDGSRETWMSRTTTDDKGWITRGMAKQSSKPTKANAGASVAPSQKSSRKKKK